jgi:carbon monoxide dehydrogenase subunit G
MRVSGREHVDRDAAALFGHLADPQRLGDALPAVQTVDVEGDGRFTATFRPATGLGVTPVAMAFEVVEREAPSRLRVRGRGGAAEWAAHLNVTLDVAAAGQGSDVSWEADVRLHGPMRSLTQRVLPGLVAEQVAEVMRATAAP